MTNQIVEVEDPVELADRDGVERAIQELRWLSEGADPSTIVGHRLDRFDELRRLQDLTHRCGGSLAYREQRELDELVDQYEDLCCARSMRRSAVPDFADRFGGTKLAYKGKVRELGKPDDAELENMLVAHVALCWVRLQMAEQSYNDALKTAEGLALAERRLSACQQRFLRAVGMLAKVRRLAEPSLQVNIGAKQLNLAGGT